MATSATTYRPIWKLISDSSGAPSAIEWAVFSPDSSKVLTSSDDGTAQIWDVQTRKLSQVLLEPTGAEISSAWFSPDDGGRLVVTSSDDGTSRVWNATTGGQVEVLAEPNGDQVANANFSPNGQFIVTCSGSIHVWSVATGQLLTTSRTAMISPIVSSPPMAVKSRPAGMEGRSESSGRRSPAASSSSSRSRGSELLGG